MPKEVFNVYRNITILVNGTFAFLAGIMAIVLLDKGLGLAQVGLYFSIYSLGVLVFEIPTGAFADAYGRKKAVVIGFVLHLVFLLGFLLVPQGPVFMGFALVVSLADAMISGSMEAHMVDMLIVRRKRSYTQRLLASGFGWGIFTLLLGTIVGGYAATYSMDYPVILGAVFAVLGIVYCQLKLKEKPRTVDFVGMERRIASSMLKAFKRSWGNDSVRALYIFSLFFGLGVVGLFSFWQPVMQDLAGWDTGMLGTFFALISVAIIIGSRISGRLEANLKTLSIAGFALSIMLLILYGANEVLVIAGAMLALEVLWGLITPMQNAIVNHNTSSDLRATVISIKAMFGRIGWVLFGILVFFIGAGEPRFFWLLGAIFMVIGTLVLFLNSTKKR